MFPAWSGAGAKGCPLAARWSPTAAGQVPLPRRERSHREQCGQHARRLLVLLQVTAGGRALPGGGAVRTEPLSARGGRVTPPWSPGAAGRPPHPPVSGARAFWGVSLSFAVQPPPTLLVLCLYCMELKLTSTWALASRGTGGTHTHWPLLLLGPGAKPTPGGVAATQPLTPDFAALGETPPLPLPRRLPLYRGPPRPLSPRQVGGRLGRGPSRRRVPARLHVPGGRRGFPRVCSVSLSRKPTQ